MFMWTSSRAGFQGKAVFADFLGDVIEGGFDFEPLRLGQDADFLQHGGMGQRAENILFPQAPVKGNRLGEMSHIGPGSLNWPLMAPALKYRPLMAFDQN